jgi:hypothetical protein
MIAEGRGACSCCDFKIIFNFYKQTYFQASAYATNQSK